MCGIAGIVRTERGHAVEAAIVRAMCDTIVHRGPDEDGVHTGGPVGLGMRRLSIIDVAGGSQPIYNEDESVVIVYNGEVYNFQELRDFLEPRGHRFRTHCDTEAIVHLYEELGPRCVEKLRGMFAFAIYDYRNHRLLLARDRVGKKPLYYAHRDGELIFGSEIKALRAYAPELTANLDPQALLEFFFYGYIPDPRSAFPSIRKLPPAHTLVFEQGRVSLQEYWDLPRFGTAKFGSESECLEELERVLSDAVRMRLISDVPLGALLSGGVDSSLVVGLMARHSSRPVKTFSIGFSHKDFDEASHARRVSQAFGTEHHELEIHPDIGNTLEHITSMMEEPFADSSTIPTYHVSKMAREHVTVALSGDGGDELFAGYARYRGNIQRQTFDIIPSALGRLYRKLIYPALPLKVRTRKISYNATLSPRDRFVDGLWLVSGRDREQSLLSPEYLEESARTLLAPELIARNYYDRAPASDHLSRMQYVDIKTYLTADILEKVDRMSMATSLEVRCPLLDHVFVETATSLEAQWKLRNGHPKYILKKLAEKIGVPRDVIYRPKQGFSLPLTHWIRQELRTGVFQILLEPRFLQRGFFNPKSVARIIGEHERNERDHEWEIWLLLVFELWHRNFLERANATAAAGDAALRS